MSTIEQGLAELQRRKQQGDPALQNVDLNTLGGAKSTQSNLESILQQGGQNIGVSPGRQAASNFLSVLGGGKAQFTAKATDALKPKSELEKLLERAKVAEAAQTLGNRPLFESITGQGQVQAQAQPGGQPQLTAQAPQAELSALELPDDTQDDLDVNSIQAPEIDRFTKQPTSRGLQQKALNDIILTKLKDQEKNLSGEAAVRFSGSIQGLTEIQDIIDLLKFTRNEQGDVEAREDIIKVILGQKAAGFRELRPFGIPITGGLAEGAVQAFAGNDARKLELKLKTLAENVLRARTGAQAPEPEQVREEVRSFLRLLDSPEIMLDRLLENEVFLKGMVNAVRKGRAPEVSVPQPEQEFQQGTEQDDLDSLSLEELRRLDSQGG